jgi:hypothetical protein
MFLYRDMFDYLASCYEGQSKISVNPIAQNNSALCLILVLAFSILKMEDKLLRNLFTFHILDGAI